jgi:energy-coupling factor transporter ATP-binding protein EcfA2
MSNGNTEKILRARYRSGQLHPGYGHENMLEVKNLSYTYPGAAVAAISSVSLSVRSGECLCITGHSGCGKTTLLLAIKGLLHDGEISGDIGIGGPIGSVGLKEDSVGLVFQNAETQIFCSTVAEEVAFGPENLCVPPDEIGRRIQRALEDVRLPEFRNRNVERLSAGQKHRLAIASVLSMETRILLLDEPTSQLDASGKRELAEVLKELKEGGYSILIAEHNLEPFKHVVDRYICMEKGRIVAEYDCMPPALYSGEGRCYNSVSVDDPPVEKAIIIIDGLSLSYPGTGVVLKDVNLSISPGERIHLYGQNGSGKSSLLGCLAGAVQPDAGALQVAGIKVGGTARMFGKVGFLFQNPQRQLFENTVYEEVAFSLKRLRLSADEVHEHVMKALEICEADDLVGKLPLSLSFGEQHRVALASVIAPGPEILLLDEPFAGLDIGQRYRLLKILANLSENHGNTVIIASHDPLPDQSWANRTLTMKNGVVE